MIRMTFKIPAPLRNWYQEFAVKADRPIGELFREALTEHRVRLESKAEEPK